MLRHENFDEEKNRILDVITYVGIAMFFVLFALLAWTESYSIVWRSTMRIDIPGSIVFTSLTCTFLVVFFAVKTFRKNIPRQHQWVLVYYAVLLLGFPTLGSLTKFGLIVNRLIDFSKPKTFQTAVISAKTSKGWKGGGRSWQMTVKDWRSSSNTVKISIDKQEYNAINIGSPVRVVTKSGFLGFEWIVSRSIGAK